MCCVRGFVGRHDAVVDRGWYGGHDVRGAVGKPHVALGMLDAVNKP